VVSIGGDKTEVIAPDRGPRVLLRMSKFRIEQIDANRRIFGMRWRDECPSQEDEQKRRQELMHQRTNIRLAVASGQL
jgi:hypothetical protein